MKTSNPQPKPVLRCLTCHKEIPHANVLSIEGKEYAYHFCGQTCFQQWERQSDGEQQAGSHTTLKG